MGNNKRQRASRVRTSVRVNAKKKYNNINVNTNNKTSISPPNSPSSTGPVQQSPRLAAANVNKMSRLPTFVNDDLFSDNFDKCMPELNQTYTALIISMIVQCIIFLLAFLAHHHRLKTYDCCNMWAVVTAISIVVYQIFYLDDWKNKYLNNPQWHRNNIFVPMAFFVVLYGAAVMGAVSMLAHNASSDIFQWVALTALNATAQASFLICTCTAIFAFTLFLAADYAHRINIGLHLYYVNEDANATIELLDITIPMNPAGVGWSMLKYIATLFQIDCSSKIVRNLPRVIIAANVFQAIFYAFAAVAYSQSHAELAPIIIVALFFLTFMFNWNYIQSSQTDAVKSRRWNRSMLWHGQKYATIIAMVYLSAMANLFFSTTNQDLWDITVNLSGTELAYLVLLIMFVFIFFFIQLYIAHIHRVLWARERDIGEGVRDPNEIRAEHTVFGVVVGDKDPVEQERLAKKKKAAEEKRLAKLKMKEMEKQRQEEEKRRYMELLDVNAHKHERHLNMERSASEQPSINDSSFMEP